MFWYVRTLADVSASAVLTQPSSEATGAVFEGDERWYEEKSSGNGAGIGSGEVVVIIPIAANGMRCFVRYTCC